jgi:hypothetical protein
MHCLWLQIALTLFRCQCPHCRGADAGAALMTQEAAAASLSEGSKASTAPAAITIHVVAGDIEEGKAQEGDEQEEEELVSCVGRCCRCTTIPSIAMCMAWPHIHACKQRPLCMCHTCDPALAATCSTVRGCACPWLCSAMHPWDNLMACCLPHCCQSLATRHNCRLRPTALLPPQMRRRRQAGCAERGLCPHHFLPGG